MVLPSSWIIVAFWIVAIVSGLRPSRGLFVCAGIGAAGKRQDWRRECPFPHPFTVVHIGSPKLKISLRHRHNFT